MANIIRSDRLGEVSRFDPFRDIELTPPKKDGAPVKELTVQ
jgi:hypothetical protein